MSMTWLFLALVFTCTAALSWLALNRWMQRPLQQRLQALRDQARDRLPHDAPFRLPRWTLPPWLRAWAVRLAQLALPSAPSHPATAAPSAAPAASAASAAAYASTRPWEAFALRWRFLQAGLRDPQAPLLHFALKALLTFALPLLWLALNAWTAAVPQAWKALGGALLLAGMGYWVPDAWLRWRIARRQRELLDSFPDALDLMLVCVEAGQGLDAAVERVARDIALQSPPLADELRLLALELRTGASRAEALRHLALRVGLDDVDALISTLVQADRFGTRISDALRVHAQALRQRRRLRAEEAAAKLPVQLVLPLVFCIFPGLLVVLMGPPAIRAVRVLMPMLSGGG